MVTTRKEIGETLKEKYDDTNEHINHFFFEIQVQYSPNYPIDMKICQEKVRSTLPTGNTEWKLVEDMTVKASEKFTFHFFGEYQDGQNQRNREKKLDEIRHKLEQKLLKNTEEDNVPAVQLPTVKITITRACKYHEIEDIN